MGLVSLTSSPSGWLLPVLLTLIAVELAIIFGKRLRCGEVAREVRRLSVRRYEIAREIKGLAIPTDFVKKSKLERSLILVEKDLTPSQASYAEQAKQYDAAVQKLKYGLWVVLVLLFWSTPLVKVEGSATWPLAAFFAFPRLPAGAIGVSACITVVQAVTKPWAPLLVAV